MFYYNGACLTIWLFSGVSNSRTCSIQTEVCACLRNDRNKEVIYTRDGNEGVSFHKDGNKETSFDQDGSKEMYFNQVSSTNDRLLSCLMIGLPMVLHPVIFLRLLLHRLLSSMETSSAWKSDIGPSSMSSQSQNERNRCSSGEVESDPTLRRRRKCNLVLNFNHSQESEKNSEHTLSKSKKNQRKDSETKDKDDDQKSHTGIYNVFHKTIKSRQNSFNSSHAGLFSKSSSVSKNDTPTGISERSWKIKDTFVNMSSKDFLSSVLKSSDSRQSITNSSTPDHGSPTVISPPAQRRKSFRFKSNLLSKSNVDTSTSSESTPNMTSSEKEDDEQFINDFQKQLQNLPSYEKLDFIAGNNIRPRSRSVPRVAYNNSFSFVNAPVSRSPSLIPSLACRSHSVAPTCNYLSASVSHLAAPSNILSSTPLVSPSHSKKLPAHQNAFEFSRWVENNQLSGRNTATSPYVSSHASTR